ncbi:hypothetical protein FOZ63_015547, partial [Perkinsus olseni]
LPWVIDAASRQEDFVQGVEDGNLLAYWCGLLLDFDDPWSLPSRSGYDYLQIRPESPSVTTVKLEGVNALVSFPTGGQTILKLPNLSPGGDSKDAGWSDVRYLAGTLHDLYCATADPILDEDDDLIATMPEEDMWASRRTVHTKGPTPMWKSVECTAGTSCTVSGLTGFGLKPGDGLVVRSFGSECR